MRLGGNARFMTDIHSSAEVAQIVQKAAAQNLRMYVLGGGSNTVVRDEGFDGLVLRNRIPGFEVVADTASDTTIKIGAGEDWDSVVKRTVDMNLIGIECLSAIPGTAGAAPVQNIGAYGQEVADEISILYGGSVKPDNAKEIFSQPDIDGGLIGGAALKIEDFAKIIEGFNA